MQPLHTDGIGLAALILVFLCWIIFALLFVLRKKPPKAEEAKRVSAAKWGIFLQGCGFALVGSVHRAYWWPFSRSTIGEIALATVAVALALASDLWCMRAIRVLGKQWTYEARVIKGHELITSGPFAVVRNPIYATGVGLLLYGRENYVRSNRRDAPIVSQINMRNVWERMKGWFRGDF